MHSWDDDQRQDGAAAGGEDDAPAPGRILHPYLFNVHDSDGTHGPKVEMRARPPLKVVMPEESDEEEVAERLSLVAPDAETEMIEDDGAASCIEDDVTTARMEDNTVAARVESDATTAPAEAPVSVIDWAGGDRRAWRTMLEPATEAAAAMDDVPREAESRTVTPQHPLLMEAASQPLAPPTIASTVRTPAAQTAPTAAPHTAAPAPAASIGEAPKVEPIAEVAPVVRVKEPAHSKSADPFEARKPEIVRSAAPLPKPVPALATVPARAAVPVRANRKLVSRVYWRDRFRGMVVPVKERLSRLHRPRRADITRRLNQWRLSAARRAAALFRSGPLASFRWRIMLRTAGGTAASGVAFVMLLKTLLN